MTPGDLHFRFSSDKRRLEELRKKNTEKSVSESISESKSVIIINLAIDIISGVIVLVGIALLLRFFMMKRDLIDPLVYRLSFGCLAVFSFGWFSYFFIRLRKKILLLNKAGTRKHHSSLSDN